jgi:hypothetical protein
MTHAECGIARCEKEASAVFFTAGLLEPAA